MMDFPNTPPTKGSREMRAALAEMLSEMVLNDPDSPESLKMPVRVINASKTFYERLHAATTDVIVPLRPDSSDEEIRKAGEFLEYVQLMAAGFDNFMEQYKTN